MKQRRVSLTVKVNILLVGLVLLTAGLLFFSSERSFRHAVFDPCTQKLEKADRDTDLLEPCFPSLKHYIGTEALNEAVVRNLEDNTALRTWMTQQPSMSEDKKTATLMEDFDRFFNTVDYLRMHNDADTSFAEIEKGGKTWLICLCDRSYRGDALELFGAEEGFLPPEDFADPGIFRDGDSYFMLRCVRLDLGDGDRLNLWSMMNMTDEISEYRQFTLQSVLFILGLTVLASVAGILLMRRLVTRPIRRLAKGTEAFTPEEDGTYSREKIISDEIRTRDEIGELSRDIRAMQEGIISNTQKLALMSAEKERIRTELDMAAGIQASALPSTFPAFPERTDFSIWASMTPAKEVGGDFYDFFLIDDTHLGVVMADVSDKGVPAALFMMTARTVVQVYAKMKLSPAETLRSANEWLSGNNKSSMFVTLWFGILDLATGVITAVNAGHEFPVLKSGSQPFRLFRDKHGFIAGVSPKAKYTEYELRMAPGDRLFLYTDGVPEAQTAEKEMFGPERMVAALNQDPNAPLEQLLANVRTAVDSFIQGAVQFDDLTMLCLEYRGSAETEDAHD